MHIPDGFINASTSLGAGAAAAGGLGVALRQTARVLDDRAAPLAGLVAAFVFAAQMVNFPVAGGTSGHLLGGVLAAVLVGPWTGALCIAVVLLVQALFADGGLTALGLNITNLALVGALGGYACFVVLRTVLPRSRAGVVTASGLAAGVSVVFASVAFVIEYALGATAPVPAGTVFTAMVGIHMLIAIGEGVITALAIGAVLKVRPDLVYGASDLLARARAASTTEAVAGSRA